MQRFVLKKGNTVSLKTSRNDPCPCGSNKKYKSCCGKKGFRLDATLFKRIFLAVLLIVAAGWAGNRYLLAPDQDEPFVDPFATQQADRVQPLTPQPPGAAPAGKVWSSEHGHWHNDGALNPNSDGEIYPQPDGLVPPGKVWSPEHGHWHDSSGTEAGSENFQPGPPPPGPAPEGKTWAYDHGHWHDSPSSATGSENLKSSPAPPGPAPEGKVWSEEHGHWHNAPTSNISDTKKITPAGVPGDVKISASDNPKISTGNFKPGPPPPGPVPEGKVWSSDHGHWHNAPGSPNQIDIAKKNLSKDLPDKAKVNISDEKGD